MHVEILFFQKFASGFFARNASIITTAVVVVAATE
jgi:hypothetical protein